MTDNKTIFAAGEQIAAIASGRAADAESGGAAKDQPAHPNPADKTRPAAKPGNADPATDTPAE
jgi:hypothetical protein